jgi:8-oxo-dGTP diphosphatase
VTNEAAASPVSVTVSGADITVEVAVTLLTLRQGRLAILAVPPQVTGDRFWSLPSNSWGVGSEDGDVVAASVLGAWSAAEPTFLEQLRTYTGAGVVTIAYVAVVPEETAMFDPSRTFALDDVVGSGFVRPEHVAIVDDAVERVRSKLEYTSVATSLVTEPFTIPELRRVYEAVWGVTLHPANFRRKVLATEGFVRAHASTHHGGGDGEKRGPDLYLRGSAALLHPAMMRPS